ncbi:WD repeat-containing protein 73-like isoform X2 [Nerophis lumbriciformis]|uniref:WD repeat-containing protein 73-like isoform X2 n=1 Tax=Nerophis lumbriciformis TaxID=546530 RepID=UPI002ADFB2D2|nr:WD repeat-containing protein 73-like isoform X2 [Nerophis lumbriciformis]XP_061812773.1 WD repeat-containing protein 73-like isoform X2 [Nerophis lumbriciformis]
MECDFDDILDDWFIESLKTYKDLHVYQLEFPTRVIEWTSGKTVCVAGYRPHKNELLELCLPLKLFAEEKKGLCAERDFKVVNGGFSHGAVSVLKHVPGTRLAVTNDGLTSDLQVWDLGGDDSDVITRTASVTGTRSAHGGGAKMAAVHSSEPEVLHGVQSGDVRLTRLWTGQNIYELASESADLLTSLHFLSEAVFLAACSNGNLHTVDTRTPSPPQLVSSMDLGSLWWTDVSTGASGCRLVRVSSTGRAVLSDLRNPAGAVSQAQLAVGTLRQQHPGADDVTVRWAPTLQDAISVSGFSGDVQIYSATAWGAEPTAAAPLFEHRGHAVSSQAADGAVVTAHVWHPKQARTLLSAASDGSLHVWDWNQQPDG